MLGFVITALKVLGVLAVLALAFAVYVNHSVMKRIKFYSDQGASHIPGYDNFLLGNIK